VWVEAGELLERMVASFQGSAGALQSPSPLLFGLGTHDHTDRVCALWPSGATQCVAGAAADGVVRLVEPKWVTLGATTAEAGGAAVAVEVKPVDGNGQWLGAGHQVQVTSTAGSLDPVMDQGDGRYTTQLHPPERAGTAQLRISLDGQLQPARPTVTITAQ
jgi:hypothetical protein